MKYTDITEQIVTQTKKQFKITEQNFYVDSDGTKYEVDNKHVVFEPTEREREVANMIGEICGGEVNIVPRVNEPSGVKTPDYIINGDKFDLKEITGHGKYVIEGNIKKKQKQANNFIIDITNAGIDMQEAIRQIENIYNTKRYEWVDRLFLLNNSEFLKIFKRQ